MKTLVDPQLFVKDIEAEIIKEIRIGQLTNSNEVNRYISEEIYTATIYTADCWNIVREIQGNEPINISSGTTVTEWAKELLGMYLVQTIDNIAITDAIEAYAL